MRSIMLLQRSKLLVKSSFTRLAASHMNSYPAAKAHRPGMTRLVAAKRFPTYNKKAVTQLSVQSHIAREDQLIPISHRVSFS